MNTTATPADNPDYGWSSGHALSLHDKIRADLKTALLGKDAAARDTLRQILSEFPTLTVPLVLESGKKTTRVKKSEEKNSSSVFGNGVMSMVQQLLNSLNTLVQVVIGKELALPWMRATLRLYLKHL